VVGVLQGLESSFGIRPDFEALFDHPTVAALARIIDSLVKGGAAAPSTRDA
jgi:acyl carrier protein